MFITAFILFLLHPDHLADIIASASCLGQDGFAHLVGDLRGAGKNPQVFVRTAADQHPLIVFVEQHDAVVPVEGTEEGDAQHARVGGEFGLAPGPLRRAGFDAAVEHLHLAVFAKRIVCLAVREATLEDMVEAGDFVPVAEVAVQFEAAGYAVVYL